MAFALRDYFGRILQVKLWPSGLAGGWVRLRLRTRRHTRGPIRMAVWVHQPGLLRFWLSKLHQVGDFGELRNCLIGRLVAENGLWVGILDKLWCADRQRADF